MVPAVKSTDGWPEPTAKGEGYRGRETIGETAQKGKAGQRRGVYGKALVATTGANREL